MLQGDEFHLKLATAALSRANGAIFYFFVSLYLREVAITHEHVVGTSGAVPPGWNITKNTRRDEKRREKIETRHTQNKHNNTSLRGKPRPLLFFV